MKGKPGILKYFKFDHLPEKLQAKSKPFHDLAHSNADGFEDLEPEQKAEVAAGLRKLLEAKDCLVRAGV